jgi:hypothetical protein
MVCDAQQGTFRLPKVRLALEEQPAGADRPVPEGGLYHDGGGGESGGIEALIKLKNWVSKVPVRPKALVK